MHYRRYKKSRHWAVYSDKGELLFVCVYKKGAANAVRLLLTLRPAEKGVSESHVG